MSTNYIVPPTKFMANMMIYLLKSNEIHWRPTLTSYRLWFTRGAERNYISMYVLIVGMAIQTLIPMEFIHRAEEFESLADCLGNSQERFKNYFTNVIRRRFIFRYYTFGFIMYLTYVASFAIYCYQKGYTLAPDYAVHAMSEVMLSERRIFVRFRSWDQLLVEASCLITHNFQYPYIPRYPRFR